MGKEIHFLAIRVVDKFVFKVADAAASNRDLYLARYVSKMVADVPTKSPQFGSPEMSPWQASLQVSTEGFRKESK